MATGTLLCLLLGCGEKTGQTTAPPAPVTNVITVGEIITAPGNFYGREVRLEGVITKKLTEDPTYEFTDGTGSIPVEFVTLLGVPMTNSAFRLTGTAVRGYTQVSIRVSDWKYMTPT